MPDVCTGCCLPITTGGMISLETVKYHEQCFCCTMCRCTLAPTSEGKSPCIHLDPSKRPLCAACWRKAYAERCAVCHVPFDSRQQLVVYDGKKIHTTCFRCAGPCGQVLGEGAKKGENRRFHRQDGKPYCAECFTQLFSPKCNACAKPIEGGSRYIKHRGKKLHPACFCCAECGCGLDDAEHYERDGSVYCASDYQQRYGQECAICKSRLLSWIATEAGETYCAKHEKDSPPCHGCGRLVAPGSGGSDLADGRVSCAACSATAICSVEQARVLLRQVRAFLVGRGLPSVPDERAINLELCERSELLERNSIGGGHGSLGSTTTKLPAVISSHRHQQCPLGLTCAEETTATFSGDGRRTSERQRTVRCVCVLKGLPSEVFASTLAHEFGHVYMHLNDGFDTMSSMPPYLAEGICELFAYLWLTEHNSVGAAETPPPLPLPRVGTETKSGGAPTQQTQQTQAHSVRAVRVKAMLSNKDAIYGDGFRAALAAYYAVGSSLPLLLEEVRRTRRLPGGAASSGRFAAGGSPARLLRPQPAVCSVASPTLGSVVSSPPREAENLKAFAAGGGSPATAAGGAAAAATLLARGGGARASTRHVSVHVDSAAAAPILPLATASPTRNPVPPGAAPSLPGFGRAIASPRRASTIAPSGSNAL